MVDPVDPVMNPVVDPNQAAQEPADPGLAEGVNTEKSAPEDPAERGTSGTEMKQGAVKP